MSGIAEYNPDNGMISVMLSNYGDNVWALMRKIRENIIRLKRRKYGKTAGILEV